MATSPITDSVTRRAVLVGAAGVALVGCSNNPDASGGAPTGAAGGSGAPQRTPTSTSPVATISTAHGLATMWPNEPINIEVEHGSTSCRLVSEDHVLGHRHDGHELEVLVHHADAAGDGVARVLDGGRVTLDRGRPRVGGGEAADLVDQQTSGGGQSAPPRHP